ncbi:hypothetical protein ACJH6H_05980 [Mycobacterium sp. SMC-21]|uniref:hypothetical protein n=1 Tax=Mycobacteriaceae TaxID=1762 RepID=UPI001BB41888|nr:MULTISPECIES: hypothetical protein [unclassified Mycolicibacterium]
MNAKSTIAASAVVHQSRRGNWSNMFSRVLALAGAAAVLGALLSTAIPVQLGAVDRFGTPIPCGTGFRPDFEVARVQDQINLDLHTNRGPMFAPSNYVEQCQSILADRQSTTLPVGAGGVVALIAAVVLWSHRRPQAGEEPAMAPVLTPPFSREAALS